LLAEGANIHSSIQEHLNYCEQLRAFDNSRLTQSLVLSNYSCCSPRTWEELRHRSEVGGLQAIRALGIAVPSLRSVRAQPDVLAAPIAFPSLPLPSPAPSPLPASRLATGSPSPGRVCSHGPQPPEETLGSCQSNKPQPLLSSSLSFFPS